MPYAKMEAKKTQCSQRNRFVKLSLKKNKTKLDKEPKKIDHDSDIIILDESFDRLQSEFHTLLQKKPKLHSPVVVNKSFELSDDDLPKIQFKDKEPSKCGNVSFDCSRNKSPDHKTESRPSIGGWSPAQHIICATPRNDPIPTTPKDTANESSEKCTMNKIQQSQKKLLNDLYGETWKSIPALFKTIKKNYNNFDGVTKKLHFDDEEKENIRHDLKRNKELYLTASELKRNENNYGDAEKKSKKKLFTEKVPCTPDIKDKVKSRNVNSTTKKNKIQGMSVTDLVRTMNGLENDLTDNNKINLPDSGIMKLPKNGITKVPENGILKPIDGIAKLSENGTIKLPENGIKKKVTDKVKRNDKVDGLTKKIENVYVTPSDKGVGRLTFMGSLADNVPSWRCHVEALQYKDNYKTLRDQLTRRLYQEFNKFIFNDSLDADMPVLWDTKLRSTAGTTTNRLIKNSKGDRIRMSSIKLSSKVVDAPQRLRDTLVHELCHAATWLLDAELRAGHGPLWKKWAAKALRVYPELGDISRCHDLEIHFKYSYKCTKCGYSIQRHSKSIDITKKCCGYCGGTFEIVINKKNKDGVVISTPARKGNMNEFAQFVKDNYAFYKEGRTHAQVMKVLSGEFSRRKNEKIIGSDCDSS